MRPIIRGTLQPILCKRNTDYDPNKGITQTIEYESAGDNLNGLALECQNQKMQYTHTANQVRSRLVAVATGPQLGVPEVPVDSWQLLANEVQAPLKAAPSVLAMLTADPNSLQEVLQAEEDYRSGGSAAIAATWFTDSTTAALLFRQLINGNTHFNKTQYVLRHGTNVSNQYNSNVADQNVEKIYSTSQLVSEISNAGFWLFPAPGRFINKIERIEQQETHADLIWGWRKLASTETTAANNRVDIATEYWLGGWPRLTYSAL